MSSPADPALRPSRPITRSARHPRHRAAYAPGPAPHLGRRHQCPADPGWPSGWRIGVGGRAGGLAQGGRLGGACRACLPAQLAPPPPPSSFPPLFSPQIKTSESPDRTAPLLKGLLSWRGARRGDGAHREASPPPALPPQDVLDDALLYQKAGWGRARAWVARGGEESEEGSGGRRRPTSLQSHLLPSSQHPRASPILPHLTGDAFRAALKLFSSVLSYLGEGGTPPPAAWGEIP